MYSRYYLAKALFGKGIELTLITAAFLGMLAIAFAQNWMIMIKVHSSYPGIIIAVLVLVLMMFNSYLSRKRSAV